MGAKQKNLIGERIEKIPFSTCWYWTGPVNSGGYGTISGKLAHRVMYENYVSEIKDGKILMHTCDTPCCVNPDHLIEGNHKENNMDCSKKGRWGKRRYSKLTEDQVREIRYFKYIPAKFFMRKYNISKQTVSAIRNNVSWKEV